jgi:hypothetical protein
MKRTRTAAGLVAAGGLWVMLEGILALAAQYVHYRALKVR